MSEPQIMKSEIPEPVTQWLTFVLGDEKYAVKVIEVQEVLRYSPIAPVPGAPMFVLGIINLRGNVVTVVDARQRFGMPTLEEDDLTRIIIIDIQGQIIGLLVDSVSEVIDLTDDDIESAPEVSNSETSAFVQGITHKNDQLHILIDLDKLLGDDLM